MLTKIFFYFAFLALLLYLKKEFDRYLIVKLRITPHHTSEIAVIGSACFLAAIILFGLQPVIIGILAVSMATWWFAFDYLLNVARGLESDYIGKTAELDKFLRIDAPKQYIFKSLAMAIAITILIITINL